MKDSRPQPSDHPRAIRHGFTLVELMVAVLLCVALAVLAAGLFSSARERARESVSTQNLRQLAVANLTYAAEHGTYAPATDPSNRVRWHGAREGGGGRFDPEKGYLSPYLGGSRRVGRCPGFEPEVRGANSWEDGSGGYGYNAIYLGGTPDNPFQPNRPANVAEPSRTLMFATTAFATAGGLQEYPFADPWRWTDPNWQLHGRLEPSVHFRFRGRALVAWCDGRVSAESPGPDSSAAAPRALGFPGPSEDNGWWNPRR